MLNINGYEYSIDPETGTTTARGTVQEAKAERDASVQLNAGGSAREATDQGGHLIASRMNGSAVPENTFAQDAHLNQGPYKTVENAEMRLASDKENIASVYVEKTAYMSNPMHETDVRPDAFIINDTITYTNGNVQNVHLSFSNMTVAEQEAINSELEKTDIESISNPNDSLRASMSPDEYAELMTSTDVELSNIRDEFDEHISISTPIEPDMDSAEISSGSSADWDFTHDDFEPEINDEMSADWSLDNSCEADCGIEEAEADVDPSSND